MKSYILPSVLAILALRGLPQARAESTSYLELVRSGAAGESLKRVGQFSQPELKKIRATEQRERDPESRKNATWRGPLLSQVVQTALDAMTAQERSEIDLLILSSRSGKKTLFSRAFMKKYPLILALARDGKSLGEQAPQIIPPWSTHPRIQSENIPVEALFLPSVATIEFAYSRQKFPELFLKRRTDPAAMRGERTFVQNCLTCHAVGRGPSLDTLVTKAATDLMGAQGHPEVAGAPKLDDRDRRAVVSYLVARQAERAAPPH